MAFITADRVLDSSTSTGTGAFVVSGTPAAGYRTFSAVMSVSDTCYYSIQGQTTSEWEVGFGTYSSANTLTRTTVYSSSNSGSAVTFSAGTKNVFITMAAARSPQLDPSGNVTALGTPASIALTNATNLPLATGVTGTLSANNGGSVAWQSVQTASFTAVAGNAYPVNTTSAAITVTLPASPSAGNIVQLTDYAGTWATNNVTVAPNGAKITGSTSNSVLAIAGSSLALVYIDATQGWIPYSAFKTLTSGQPYSASYLVVAGGGAGGGAINVDTGGGAGAGGFLTGTTTLNFGTTYSFTVGGGGAGVAQANGGNGSNSTGFGLTATGGGGGSYRGNTAGSGGSGGGTGTGGTAGSGTSGQGTAGGVGVAGNTGGGGGGGATSAGAAGATNVGGAGGAGTASSITGSSVTYAGGGGGAGISAAGSGGAGGGGAGQATTQGSGTAGTANTGGGGGGSYSSGLTSTAGAAGGSGVVIFSIPTINYTGTYTGTPTITTSGSSTIIKFTASGSYTA